MCKSMLLNLNIVDSIHYRDSFLWKHCDSNISLLRYTHSTAHAHNQTYTRYTYSLTDTHTDRQTDRQTHTLTDRHTDRQTDTLTDRQWQTHTLTDTHTDRQTHWQTGRHTHTDRLTDRQTHTHRHAADIHWQTHTHTHKSTDRHTDTLTDRQTNQALYYQISSSDPYSVLLEHQSTSITNERAGQESDKAQLYRIAGHFLWHFIFENPQIILYHKF